MYFYDAFLSALDALPGPVDADTRGELLSLFITAHNSGVRSVIALGDGVDVG
jgi:hypothetical protein